MVEGISIRVPFRRTVGQTSRVRPPQGSSVSPRAQPGASAGAEGILEADDFSKLFRTNANLSSKLTFEGPFSNKERIADFFDGRATIAL